MAPQIPPHPQSPRPAGVETAPHQTISRTENPCSLRIRSTENSDTNFADRMSSMPQLEPRGHRAPHLVSYVPHALPPDFLNTRNRSKNRESKRDKLEEDDDDGCPHPRARTNYEARTHTLSANTSECVPNRPSRRGNGARRVIRTG